MAAVSASSMLEFVRRIFRERRDHGMLTIRQLRTLYTDELKVKHLSSENREVFASIVTTVFKEFEDLAESRDKSSQGIKADNDTSADSEDSSLLRSVLPQNGNCNIDASSPIRCPNAKNVQRIVDSSSDSDDDDVIRAVKETLGVQTRRRTQPKQPFMPNITFTTTTTTTSTVNSTSNTGANTTSLATTSNSQHISLKVPPSVSSSVLSSASSSVCSSVSSSTSSSDASSVSSSISACAGASLNSSSNLASSLVPSAPVKEASHDESSAAASCTATSTVCGAIPTVVFPVVSVDKAEAPCGGDASDSSDSEGKLMIAESPMSAESPRRPSSDGEGSARIGEPAGKMRRSSLPIENKKAKPLNSNLNEGSKTPTQESNGKDHKSMDDMPLFTLKLTKTKTGGWIMVKPKSEESDAGDETSAQKPNVIRRKRVAAPRKTKEKITESTHGIFDSSDDEPLSELRNRPPKKKPISPQQATTVALTENAKLSDLEQKLARTHKRRKKPADGFPPPSKKRKPAAKSATAENPAVARLKRCISTAGLRVRYVQLLEETDTVDQKVEKLMKVLKDAGLQGKATLKSCRELRQKREEENEVRNLDKSCVVENSQDGATKRTTRSAAVCTVPSATLPEEPQEAIDEPRKVFSRLKDIIDSEDSG